MITSLQNPRVKAALRLHTPRGRKQQNRTIIFGEREIKRAVAAGVTFELLFISQANENDLEAWQQAIKAECWLVADEVMAKLEYGDRGDGLVAIAERPETSLDRFQPAGQAGNQFIVVLEAVEKPGNLGAVLRSVDAAGAHGVLINPLTDPFHPNAIRTSTGVVFSVPMATGNNEAIQTWLAKNKFRVFTAFLESAKPFFEQPLIGNTAIVLGNEANGLSEAWRRPEYQPVKIPMNGIADSLNVSVTASVMLYEAMRQRSNPAPS